MKKCISLLLICVALCTAGCSNSNEDMSNNTNKTTSSPISTTSTSEVNNEPTSYTPLKEILEADVYSGLVQVGNSLLQLPATVDEFISAGVTFIGTTFTADYIMNGGLFKVIEMEYGGLLLDLVVVNSSAEYCTLRETQVVKIYVYSAEGAYNGSPRVFFPKGIAIGKSYSELIDTLGQPTIESLPYFDYMEYPVAPERIVSTSNNKFIPVNDCGYKFKIDQSTSNITQIHYSAGNKSTDTNFVNEYIMESITYKIPSIFTFTGYYFGSKTIGSNIDGLYTQKFNTENPIAVLNIDNIDFIIILDTQYNQINNSVVLSDIVSDNTFSEIDSDDGKIGKAIGFTTTENSMSAFIVKSFADNYYTYSNTIISPLNPRDSLTENAVIQFKAIVTNYVDSINELTS